MNRKRSKLVQVMVVAVVMIGLLVAAWPGVAQSARNAIPAFLYLNANDRHAAPSLSDTYQLEVKIIQSPTDTVAEPRVTSTAAYTFSIPASIGLPTQLRVNPKRNELYARGYEEQPDPSFIPPHWYTLEKFDLATRQNTGETVLPGAIQDYGISNDGRWLYAASYRTLYTIDLNTFSVVKQFTPADVSPGNAVFWRIGVLSATLAYVSTNPGYASGGPIYQWNPQTNEWLAAPFCGSAATAVMDVARDYSAIGGVCDPNASPSTSFLYRLDGTLETWTSDIRWSAGTSPHGDWLLSSFFGNGNPGDFIAMRQGDPNYRYITASTRYSYDTTFDERYDLGYATAGIYSPPILEISPGLAAQTRSFNLQPVRPGNYYYFMPGQGPIAIKGSWMYAAVWPQYHYSYDSMGDIVAFYIESLDDGIPTSTVIGLPALSAQTFSVYWTGYDAGSTVCLYDVQYRDSSLSTWTTWLTQTTQTSGVFTGTVGHTYYFRSRSRDCVGNIESYPAGIGDTWTTIYQYDLSGQIFDNREQPVAVTSVQANPVALNTGISRHDGLYDLYFASGGSYTLNTTRSNFGTLPSLLNVTVPSSNSLTTLYLPPLDNQISDSHFESGDLSAWNPSSDLTPTITSTAHTGNYAALLGGSVPTDTVSTGPWHSTIEQTIIVSPTIVSGTLSLLYRVDAVEPLSDTLNAYLVGANSVLTFTLPVTTNGWTHAWFDVSAWTEPTATVKIDFAIGDVGRDALIILDEVTWGSAITGSYAAFLPLVRR
jgi:hypothetical protein